MRVPRHLCTAVSNQEIQIRALVSLHYMLDVESQVAAIRQRRSSPFRAACRKNIVLNFQTKLALLHVERDHVPGFYERQWATGRSLGANMQNHGSISRAAH